MTRKIAVLVFVMLLLVCLPAWATKTDTTASIAFSKNPASPGDTVTVTGKIVETVSQLPVVGVGAIQIHEVVVPQYDPLDGTTITGYLGVPCGTPGATDLNLTAGGVQGGGITPDINGQASIDFVVPTDQTNNIGFFVNFPPVGGYAGHSSACVDLQIVAPACDPAHAVSIGESIVVGNGDIAAGTSASWTLAIHVHSCLAAKAVYAQGGTSAWTTATIPGLYNGLPNPATGTDSLSAKGNTKGGNSNQVLRWTIGDTAAGDDQYLYVTLSGKVSKTCGTQQSLNGPWSVVYTIDGVSYKSAYTGQSEITSTCQ
jgi:hypothetical protein